MTRIDSDYVKSALIDISDYDCTLVSRPDEIQRGDLPEKVVHLLTTKGFCIAYGTNKVLTRHGLDTRADREKGYELLESVFRSALALIDMKPFSVTDRPMHLAKMDVDGFNLNRNFSHDQQIDAREFMTAQCIHFDAATPFVGNIYGPNENIRGGLPLICDVRQYCRDRGVAAGRMVENLQNNYNIAIKKEFYEDLLNDYSFAVDVDLSSDIAIVMFLNEIEFGVAHGATDRGKVDADKPAKRPIRHIEMQYEREEHYGEWYAHYGLPMEKADDYAGENLTLHFHEPATRPFDVIIPLPGRSAA